MKKLKQLISLSIAILLLYLCVPIPVIENIKTVEAASAKLNKTSITIFTGSTTTLRVIGASKTVRWTSNNKIVATVSSKGIVSGKTEGTALVTATVNGKEYTCKVKVKKAFNSKDALKNLKQTETNFGNRVMVELENKYNFPLQICATIVYYDSTGSFLGKSSDNNYYLETNKKCILTFSSPRDSNDAVVTYNSYKINYDIKNVSKTAHSYVDNVKLIDHYGADNITVEVSNNGKNKIESATVSIVFYKNGNVFSNSIAFVSIENPNDTEYIEFSLPCDNNNHVIIPDDHKIYVNYAYTTNLNH